MAPNFGQTPRHPRHLSVTRKGPKGGYASGATLTIAQILSGHVFKPAVIDALQHGEAGVVEYNRDAPIPNGYDPKKEQGAFYYVFRPEDIRALVAHASMYHALGGLFKKGVTAEDVTAAIQAGRLVLLPEGEAPEGTEPAAAQGDPLPAEEATTAANGDGPAVTAFGRTGKPKKAED